MNGDHQAEPLSRDQALSLFQMYEDKGWAVKQLMMAIVAWLTPFVFGLIAFSAKGYFSESGSTATTIASWTAFFLATFMAVLVLISLLHANADYVRSHAVIKYAKSKPVLDDPVLKIIPDEEGRDLLLHRVHMQHIGWQFIVIMCFAFILVLVSLLTALLVTF